MASHLPPPLPPGPLPATPFRVGDLSVRVFPDRLALGRSAAGRVAAELRARLASEGRARVVFAAAPSQDEFLAALVGEPGIDWSRIDAFHMDEYAGLQEGAPETFGAFLRERILGRLPFRAVHLLRPDATDLAEECARYGALLKEAPIDVVCLGIGENGHLAFNDPPYADFDDPVWVKPVEIDDTSRMQQVHDGCFRTVDEVPRKALTLTIPALLSGGFLSAVVPGPTKAKAIERSLFGPVSSACPASVLRCCPNAQLYLDAASARSLLPEAR